MSEKRRPVRKYAKFERKQPQPPVVRLSPAELPRPSRGFPAIVGLVGLLVVAGVTVWLLGQRPDPHYVRAAELVEAYERPRPEEARNYANDVYSEALGELGLVDPESVSHNDAVALAERILAGRRQLEQRLQLADEAIDRRRNDRRNRDLSLFARQQASRLNPVTGYPECEDHDH